MDTKRTLLLTVLWTLLLVPLLCQAGVLDHFCPACQAQACCPEVQCAADPCEIFQAARTISRADVLPLSTPGPALLPIPCGSAENVSIPPVGSHPATPLPFPLPGELDLPLIC